MIESLQRLIPPRRDLWWVLLLGLVLYLPGLGSRDLWNPDEPRYTQVAQEMLDSGEYLVPHLNGERYSHKPPLLFWAMAFFGAVTGGLDELAARLPSALAAIGAMLVLFALARAAFGRRAAWLSVVIYGTCAKTLWQGHFGQIDMLLGFLVLCAVACWMRAWDLGGSARLYRWFFVFAGLGTLAKGFVGILPPLLAIIVFLIWNQDWPSLRAFRIPTGLLFFLGVGLLWFAPAVAHAGWIYAEELLFKQSLGRYVDPWHHLQPWYYYLTTIPADFFPWVVLLPTAIVAALKGLHVDRRQRYFFLVSWAVVTVVFFSLSSAKRTVYVFQMFPALALLVGVGLDVLVEQKELLKRRWLVLPTLLPPFLFGLAAVAVAVLGPDREEVALLGSDFVVRVAASLGLLTVFLTAAAVLATRQRTIGVVAATAAGLALFSAALYTLLLPRIDRVKSVRPIAERLAEVAAVDDPVAVVPWIDPPVLFYAERFVTDLERGLERPRGDDQLPQIDEPLGRFIARDERVWVLAERNVIKRYGAALDTLYPVARALDPEDGYVLFTNDPAYRGVEVETVAP